MANELQTKAYLQIVEKAQTRQQSKYTFELDAQTAEQINKSPQPIYLTNPLDNSLVQYPTLLVQQILQNPNLFEHIQQFFKDNNANRFFFKGAQNDEAQSKIDYSLSRHDIVAIVEAYCMQDDATEEQAVLFQSLKDLSSPQKLLEDFANKYYSTNIDGKNVTFNCQDLISILNSTEQDLRSLPPEVAASQNTRQQFYALTKFVEDHHIFENYFFGRQTEDLFRDISNSQFVDIEAFNKHLKTQNDYLDKTQISPELTAEIFKGMPKDLSKLEQAQFVYLKMCSVFSYDQTYFAAGQMGKLAAKHKDISYIQELSPQNNEAVCYEFSAIYSKLLADLNINNELVFVKTSNKQTNPYGHSHSYVRFRADEYLITADPTRMLSHSDLARIKLDMQPENFYLKNKNEQTQKSFNASLDKITKIVQSLQSQDSPQDLDFNRALLKYEASTPPVAHLSTQQKFDLILDQISGSNLQPMEILSYAYILSEIVFSEQEQANFYINQVRHTPNINDLVKNHTAELGLVFSIGNSLLNPSAEDNGLAIDLSDDYFVDTKGYTRAFYSSSTGVTPLSNQDMFVKFGTGEISYIHPGVLPIPGAPKATADYVLNTEQ